MAYRHGIYASELPTSIVPPVNTEACLPVVFGTAPIHLATNRAATNKPILLYSYAEAVAQFGYSENWGDYTLCEAMYSQFCLYNVAPVVFVNVLDPAVHKTAVIKESLALTNGVATLTDPILLETLKVRVNEAGQDLVIGTDYEAIYNDSEQIILTALEGGALASAETCYLSYDKVDPSKVADTDIIGGISVTTGECRGLETLNQVFPLYGVVPGMILAPGWSQVPATAAVMKAKAATISTFFGAVSICDIPADNTVSKYTDVSSWKNQNNYTGNDQAVCWPMCKLGGVVYHRSTHLMGVIGVLCSNNDDVPYESPSNVSIQCDANCLENGTEIIIGPEQANYLNGQGIITGLNFSGGWKMWGNRTACYPTNTDPKDAFLCQRLMVHWHAQTFILTYFSKVDRPMSKRLIDTIVDSENIRLNGLAAKQYILGGYIEFVSDENALTDLIDGKMTFHTHWTPPVPAREIVNTIEFDTSNFSKLFE